MIVFRSCMPGYCMTRDGGNTISKCQFMVHLIMFLRPSVKIKLLSESSFRYDTQSERNCRLIYKIRKIKANIGRPESRGAPVSSHNLKSSFILSTLKSATPLMLISEKPGLQHALKKSINESGRITNLCRLQSSS